MKVQLKKTSSEEEEYLILLGVCVDWPHERMKSGDYLFTYFALGREFHFVNLYCRKRTTRNDHKSERRRNDGREMKEGGDKEEMSKMKKHRTFNLSFTSKTKQWQNRKKDGMAQQIKTR